MPNLSVMPDDAERVRATYEWVVEHMDGDEIIECFYWEAHDDAVRCAKGIREDGGEFDFGLCYSRGSDCDGEMDRQYAYCPRNRTTGLPTEFDGGRSVPARFLK